MQNFPNNCRKQVRKAKNSSNSGKLQSLGIQSIIYANHYALEKITYCKNFHFLQVDCKVNYYCYWQLRLLVFNSGPPVSQFFPSLESE